MPGCAVSRDMIRRMFERLFPHVRHDEPLPVSSDRFPIDPVDFDQRTRITRAQLKHEQTMKQTRSVLDDFAHLDDLIERRDE